MTSVKLREMIRTKLGVFLLFINEYGLHQREKPVQFVWFPELSLFDEVDMWTLVSSHRRIKAILHLSLYQELQHMQSDTYTIHSTVKPRSILIGLKLL